MKHEICFAYPSSDLADKMGKHGYMVIHGKETKQFDEYEDAFAFAQSLGTEPDRWSIDHHLNASFLRKAKLAYVYHQNTPSTI
jgi:hypothetical protein